MACEVDAEKQSCVLNLPLANIGEECKSQYGCEEGPCASCGSEGLCCKKGSSGSGCSGLVGGTTRHECTGHKGKI